MAYPPCDACGSTAGPEHICPGLTAQLVGKTLDGRYQIESILGQGGMGMVFQATQTSMRRAVAVKTLHPSLAAAPTFFERFRREAETASKLRHPNVITIYDFGRAQDGTCYFVMELLQGESLKQIVKRSGPMSLRRAVNLIEQAARGLAHAHNQNCVHRDLKPHNIMIMDLEGAEFVKVLDFGLVKALEQDGDEQLTSTGQVLGTPQYMPPEQAGGENVDRRSDLYSLGGVFYYCLTGTSPFAANTVRKALTAALTKQVPPVSAHRHGAPVPKSLDEFFRKAIAREKEDRYQTAEEFIVEMRACLTGLSDAQLDALPGLEAEKEKLREPGSGSHSGTDGRTMQGRSKAQKTPTPSSKAPSNVIVDPQLTTHRRATAGEIPSQKSKPPDPAPDEPKQMSTGKKLGLLAVPLALFAIGGAVVVKMRKEPEGTKTPPVNVIAANPQPKIEAPPKVDPPPVAAEVTVKLVTVPPGAAVLENGVQIGKTPLDRKWSKDELHTVTFQLNGYAELTRPFRLATDDTVEVALEPVAAKTKPSGKKDGKKSNIPVFE
jgi:eukaryotic-like serine/threonine-protein kinase